MTGIAKDSASPQEVDPRTAHRAHRSALFRRHWRLHQSLRGKAIADAADRDNDTVRVNGREVRALVIGEGANLAVTQLGRVEYAREGGPQHRGGRINTDAIDNSAGVDTSDHEVNIKILLSGPLRRGEISRSGTASASSRQ